MYDLRVRAADGVDAATGEMLAVLDTLPDPGIVAAAEERLVVSTQVDASTDEETILVPGRIVGMDLSDGGPHVNAVDVKEGHGRNLTAADAGEPVVLVERNFADFYDLPPDGTIRVAGDREVRTVGIAMAPEYFFVMTEEGGFFAEANFAALFTSLETAQDLAGKPDRVNDLVLQLAPGVDQASAARTVEAAFAEAGLGATVMRTIDEDAYRVLYDDIEGDQRFWNIFAGLILVGASFGAFNLASRMVESQRREIGIGMAMGWSRARLAVRPLLVGAQIALLGVVFGILMGLSDHGGPPPRLHDDAAAAGVAHPLPGGDVRQGRRHRLRAAVPGHRVAGVASRAGHADRRDHHRPPLGPQRPGPAAPSPALAGQRLPPHAAGKRAAHPAPHASSPRSASARPSPRSWPRSACSTRSTPPWTATSPSCWVTTRTGCRSRWTASPSRAGRSCAAVAAADSVGEVEPVLRVGGTLSTPGEEGLEVLVEAIDLQSDVWAPTFEEGSLPPDRSGIVIARKAAEDLGVGVGDTVSLEHPARQGDGFTVVRTPPRGDRHPPQPLPLQRLHRPVTARRLRRARRGQPPLCAARGRLHV